MFKFFKTKKKEQKFARYPYRLLIVQRDCVHCKLIYGVAEEFNVFLKPEKKIRIVDVSDNWNFNVDLQPIVNHIDIKGTPTLYLGGEHPILVEGVTTREWFKGFLKGYLEKAGDL
jgi:hypothetical protein